MVKPRTTVEVVLSWDRLSLRILLYKVFYTFCATESISQLIWRKWLSISDLLAQVEGKNRLINGTLILQVVKDGDSSKDGFVGVVQAQDAIKKCTLTPIFHTLRPNSWSVLTKSPICGREECSHLQMHEVGLGLEWDALSLNSQRKIEAGLCIWWTSDG